MSVIRPPSQRHTKLARIMNVGRASIVHLKQARTHHEHQRVSILDTAEIEQAS